VGSQRTAVDKGSRSLEAEARRGFLFGLARAVSCLMSRVGCLFLAHEILLCSFVRRLSALDLDAQTLWTLNTLNHNFSAAQGRGAQCSVPSTTSPSLSLLGGEAQDVGWRNQRIDHVCQKARSSPCPAQVQRDH